MGHDAEDAEEVVVAEIVVEGGVKVRGDDLPEPAATEVVEGDGGGVAVGEFAVVAVEVFSEGVGDDFIHVYGDDWTIGGLRGGHVARGLLGIPLMTIRPS